jgi:3-hydroxyacyl-[acyl-carrier-protein] dehydratase
MSDTILNIKQISDLIPHRYPFLLVDRVTKLKELGIEGYKNVSGNEPFFCGHFPEEPIMPGVLICEAAAQLGAIFLKNREEFKNKLILFAGLNNVKFKRIVVPGDRLDLKVDLLKIRPPVGKAAFVATVDGNIACQGEITFSSVDMDNL